MVLELNRIGISLPAAVPCQQYGMRSKWGQHEKLLFDNMFEHGDPLPHGTICNGGVVLVKPNAAVFDLLRSDCRIRSPWHVATRCIDAYYIGHAMKQLHCLDVSYNFSPAIIKGVAHTECWQRMDQNEVMLFHFATGIKPQEWFKLGKPPHLELGIGTTGWHSSASVPEASKLRQLQRRADFAATRWILNFCFSLIQAAYHLGMPIFQGNRSTAMRFLDLYLSNRMRASAAALHIQLAQAALRDAIFFLLRYNLIN